VEKEKRVFSLYDCHKFAVDNPKSTWYGTVLCPVLEE